MSASRLGLLTSRRFAPLFATQFLGAFNDNLYRAAMLFLITFRLMANNPGGAALAGVIAGGVFILPYFLFSSIAGELADSLDKSRVARWVKIAEVGIMVVGATALLLGSIALLYVVLFAMGVHSTVFGPVKYAILPQHLGEDELMDGTGLVEAGTFLAILLGQIAGGLLASPHAAVAVLAAAVSGLLASLFIPPAPSGPRPPRVDPNLVRSSAAILRHSIRNRPMFAAIIGISWFFALGGVLLQQLPPLASRLNADETVATLFAGLFSVGVGLGSVVIGGLLKGRISGRYAVLCAILLALAVIDLSDSVRHMAAAPATVNAHAFLSSSASWRLIADLLVIAVAGGMFVVPLYALLQTLGDAENRSRDIAANNIVNAAAMVLVTLLASVLLASGAAMPTLFLILGLAGLIVAIGLAVMGLR